MDSAPFAEPGGEFNNRKQLRRQPTLPQDLGEDIIGYYGIMES